MSGECRLASQDVRRFLQPEAVDAQGWPLRTQDARKKLINSDKGELRLLPGKIAPEQVKTARIGRFEPKMASVP